MRSTQSLARGGGRSAKGAPEAALRANGASRSVKEQAVETVGDVTRKVKDKGEQFLSQQKQRAATSLQGIGTSIREAAEQLQEGPLANVGEYVNVAADVVADASQYLGEQDLTKLRADAEDAVRARPQLFLGGMFLAGLALARFMKATEAEEVPRRRRRRGRAQAQGRAREQEQEADDAPRRVSVRRKNDGRPGSTAP